MDPQVSYGASTDRLSSRETFPSFLRTVPSDRVQVAAVVELMRELHWSWVATVRSEDEYSWQGPCLFSGLADTKGTCIAREGRMPLPRAGSPRLGSVQGLPSRVNQSSVQVVRCSPLPVPPAPSSATASATGSRPRCGWPARPGCPQTWS